MKIENSCNFGVALEKKAGQCFLHEIFFERSVDVVYRSKGIKAKGHKGIFI